MIVNSLVMDCVMIVNLLVMNCVMIVFRCYILDSRTGVKRKITAVHGALPRSQGLWTAINTDVWGMIGARLVQHELTFIAHV